MRTNKATVAACKSICDKDAQCKAVVFHKWGVMMKKDGVQEGKEGTSGADFLTFVKVRKPQWKEHKNTNIGGPDDYKACDLAMGKDVRTDADKVTACKQTCEKDVKCKAIVFHKWGVMMKKAVGAMDKEGKSGADFLTFTKMTPFMA